MLVEQVLFNLQLAAPKTQTMSFNLVFVMFAFQSKVNPTKKNQL